MLKKHITLFILLNSLWINAQTPITNSNIQDAINTCLSTNPVDGMCSDSEYGAMPDWDISNVTSLPGVFASKTNFNADISSWDVSNVTWMNNTFNRATSFNQNISSWDVSNVINMGGMFAYTEEFNQDISSWNVSSVNSMESMFQFSISFNQDISPWDVSNVTRMEQMFNGATSFNQNISSWNVSNVNYFLNMFREATAFNQDISDWDISNINGENSLYDMFSYTSLSTYNYDQILNGWVEYNISSDIRFAARGVNYCNGADARQRLIDDFGWTITDGGLDCATAGVEDENLLAISIYPNPVKDKLYIQGLSNTSKVSIFNVLGKLVLSETTTSEIDIEGLQSGIYIVKIIEQQKEATLKFIKN